MNRNLNCDCIAELQTNDQNSIRSSRDPHSHSSSHSLPWEELVMTCLQKLDSELVRYLESDGFQKEFKSLKLSRNGTHPSLMKVRGCMKTTFPYKTETTQKIEERIGSSVISHLSFTKTLASMYIMQPSKSTNSSFVSSAIRDTINSNNSENLRISERSGPRNVVDSRTTSSSYLDTTLYDDVCEDYKHIWQSAQVIQTRWRRCISDPAFSMCRNRLKKEFDEMMWD